MEGESDSLCSMWFGMGIGVTFTTLWLRSMYSTIVSTLFQHELFDVVIPLYCCTLEAPKHRKYKNKYTKISRNSWR